MLSVLGIQYMFSSVVLTAEDLSKAKLEVKLKKIEIFFLKRRNLRSFVLNDK